jgi:hypothetical protein
MPLYVEIELDAHLKSALIYLSIINHKDFLFKISWNHFCYTDLLVKDETNKVPNNNNQMGILSMNYFSR